MYVLSAIFRVLFDVRGREFVEEFRQTIFSCISGGHVQNWQELSAQFHYFG